MSLTAPDPQAALTADYGRLRDSTLKALDAKLRGRRIHFDPSDLEDFYNEAWHALYVKLGEGDHVENQGGFLVQVAFFRAIDEYRRLHPDRRDDTEDAEAAALDVDVDGRIDSARLLRAFTEGIRGELNEREGRAAVLCYLHGLSRPEAAEVLGLNESRMQKLMDGVSKKLGPIIDALQHGSWCDTRDSLIKAYALGLLDPDGERYRLAVSHLRECTACRRRVLGLRGLAVAVPPVAVPWAVLHGGATAAVSAGGGQPGNAAAAGSSSNTGVIAGVVAAVAVCAAAVAGVVALTGDEPQQRSARATPTPVVTAAPTARATPAPPRRSRPARRNRRRAAATPAPTSVPTAAPTPIATATPVVTPAPTATSVPTARPTSAPTVTRDAGEEFGFEP